MEGVRTAITDDLPRIAELVTAGIEELRPMKGGDIWAAHDGGAPPHEARLAAALADDAQRLLVGTIDGVVIGHLLGRVEDLRDGRRLGVVDEIFVEEGARGVGVGEAMMGDALAWFRAQGCVGVDAIALPGHRATKNFFEESGFSARMIVMHHRLTDA